MPAGIFLGLVLALLLNQKRRGVSLFRGIFFLPVVVSGVATTLVWGWVFNPRYGLVNALLALVGIRGPAWLQDEHWAMPALILMSLWNVGVNMVIYLAALQDVPVTFYLIVVNLIGSFQMFTPTYILTRGGPNNATLTLPLYIYLNAFSWGNLGYASTLSFILFLFIAILTLVQFRLAKRWVFYARGEG